MDFLAQISPVPAAIPAISIGPFLLLALALPVLLMGEWLVSRIGWLARSNVPPAIIGGLLVSLLLLASTELRPGLIAVDGSTASGLWLWPVLPQWDFAAPRPMDVERPLLILFFTCIGLNASWAVARRGGRPLLILLLLAIAIAALQAATGAMTAAALGENPLLGVMAGNVSLMGGFGTAAGFAPDFEKAGLPGAASIGVAAAAAGVIAGGILAGPIGGALVRRNLHRDARAAGDTHANPSAPSLPEGFIAEVIALVRSPGSTLVHLCALGISIKLGAFLSIWFQRSGITFPVYMGSMIVAAVLRNAHDAVRGRWLNTERTDEIGSVALMWLLVVVMLDLQLGQLARSALPLLVIIGVQVVLMAAGAYWIIFRAMGRDYEAATMSAGMIGFGLGAMSNAVASMRVMAQRFGPAPRAFLIVPIVGAFLVDFANAVITTTALNLLK